MKIKPLADRLLVKPNPEEEKTASGIILPDTASKEKPMQGKVVAAGPGKLDDNGARVAMEVKEGDIVLYGKYSGTDIKIDNEDYLILKESDVLAIIE